MADLIDRQAAIVAIKAEVDDVDRLNIELRWWNLGLTRASKILKLLPSAEPEQRWIPCSERLPERGMMVLITIIGTDIIYLGEGETLEDALKRSMEIKRVSVGFLGSDGWYGADGFPEIVTPRAWMPLPEPWKGEEE